MTQALVLSNVDAQGIAVVALNRPQALHALNAALRDALIATLAHVNRDTNVRAIVLCGAGDRAFCSGQDLEEASGFSGDDVSTWLNHQRRAFQALRDLDKPAVAAYNGVAAGAGFQLGLLCDLRVGYAQMKIGQPEVRAGLASIIGSYLMSLYLPLSKNVEMSLSGNLISGSEAHALGLLNQLVEREQVVERAKTAALELAALPPKAIALTKQRFRSLTQHGFDEAFDAAIVASRAAYVSGEPQAQMKKFLAQRAGKA